MSTRTDRIVRAGATIVFVLLLLCIASFFACPPPWGRSTVSQSSRMNHRPAQDLPFELNPEGPGCPDDEEWKYDQTKIPTVLHAVKNSLTMPLLWPPLTEPEIVRI